MRYIVTVAALILCYAPTASYAQGMGSHSCGKYLAAVHGHAPGIGNVINNPKGGRYRDDHHLYMAWLAGFFSAMNWWVFNGPPNAIEGDPSATDVWIRKWCERNPTKPLSEAVEAFVWDQRKDYLEAWYARQAR